ncbi:hypothetical protein CsSME_00052936 [Camellia sinensis var. sinensis]
MWVFDEGAPRFAGGVLLAVVHCFLFVVGLPFGVRLSEGEEDGLDIKNGFRKFKGRKGWVLFIMKRLSENRFVFMIKLLF